MSYTTNAPIFRSRLTSRPIKWVILSAIGPKAVAGNWITGELTADVGICRYHEDAPSFDLAKFSTDNFGGAKFQNFRQLFSQFPEIRDYDYLMFVDDDIFIDPSSLHAFMRIVEDNKLDWAQPSFSNDSDIHWPHLRHKPGLDIESTLFVEINSFALSRRLFQDASHLFEIGYSGYGIDFGMMLMSKDKYYKSAIVHSVQMHHPVRPKSETCRADTFYEQEAQKVENMLYQMYGTKIHLQHVAVASTLFKKVTHATLWMSRFLLPIVRLKRSLTGRLPINHNK